MAKPFIYYSTTLYPPFSSLWVECWVKWKIQCSEFVSFRLLFEALDITFTRFSRTQKLITTRIHIKTAQMSLLADKYTPKTDKNEPKTDVG